MFLLTVLMAADFINTVTGIMHDVVLGDSAVEIAGLFSVESGGHGVFLRFPPTSLKVPGHARIRHLSS